VIVSAVVDAVVALFSIFWLAKMYLSFTTSQDELYLDYC
jgi:hypothetical protein